MIHYHSSADLVQLHRPLCFLNRLGSRPPWVATLCPRHASPHLLMAGFLIYPNVISSKIDPLPFPATGQWNRLPYPQGRVRPFWQCSRPQHPSCWQPGSLCLLMRCHGKYTAPPDVGWPQTFNFELSTTLIDIASLTGNTEKQAR